MDVCLFVCRSKKLILKSLWQLEGLGKAKIKYLLVYIKRLKKMSLIKKIPLTRNIKEMREQMTWETLWGKGVSGGNNRSKFPETRACFMFKGRGGGCNDWSSINRGRRNGDEIRDLGKCQII